MSQLELPPTFERATYAQPLGVDRYRVHIDAAWAGGSGPSGGYLAAICLNSMLQTIDGTEWGVRSLTTHFLRGPQIGPAEVTVHLLRTGRTVTSVEATLVQDGREQVRSFATFVRGDDSARSRRAAEVPAGIRAFEDSPHLHVAGLPSLFDRLEQRVAAVEAPGDDRRRGWVRLREPRPIDALTLTLFADCWLPALAAGTDDVPVAPTLDYMVLFREAASTAPDEPVLLDIHTAAIADGMADEDVDIWSSDGRLLAQSRQLLLDR